MHLRSKFSLKKILYLQTQTRKVLTFESFLKNNLKNTIVKSAGLINEKRKNSENFDDFVYILSKSFYSLKSAEIGMQLFQDKVI